MGHDDGERQELHWIDWFWVFRDGRCVLSNARDPHMSTVTSTSVDLWRTGLSTFVHVPLASVEPSKFSVRGNVRLYGGVHSGSLKSPNPFYVILGDGEPVYLQHNGATAFVKEKGSSLRGWIPTDKGWGPAAGIELLTHRIVYKSSLAISSCVLGSDHFRLSPRYRAYKLATPRGVVGFVFLQALLCHFTCQQVKGHSYWTALTLCRDPRRVQRSCLPAGRLVCVGKQSDEGFMGARRSTGTGSARWFLFPTNTWEPLLLTWVA